MRRTQVGPLLLIAAALLPAPVRSQQPEEPLRAGIAAYQEVDVGSGEGAGGVPFIDRALASGVKAGYRFELVAGQPTTSGGIWEYLVVATPISYGQSGVRSFRVDHSGIVRCADRGGAPAESTDPPCD